MDDEKIIELYLKRSEEAIRITDTKYGKLCRKISYGILQDRQDSEECVNDTWMALWNSIPPKRPESFMAYLCRIAKNLSLKKQKYNQAAKRNSNYQVSLDELEECVSSSTKIEDSILSRELVKCINCFLGELPSKKRIIFLRRYWFMDSVKEIARDEHITEKNASMKLARIRQQLKEYLSREGYEL